MLSCGEGGTGRVRPLQQRLRCLLLHQLVQARRTAPHLPLPCYCSAGGGGEHSLDFGDGGSAGSGGGLPLVLLSLQPGSALVLDRLNISGTSSPEAGKAELPTWIEVGCAGGQHGIQLAFSRSMPDV